MKMYMSPARIRDAVLGRARPPPPNPPPHRIWWSPGMDCWVFGGEGYDAGYSLIRLTEGAVTATLPADAVELTTKDAWDDVHQ